MQLSDCKEGDRITVVLNTDTGDIVRLSETVKQSQPLVADLIFFDVKDTGQPFMAAYLVGQSHYPSMVDMGYHTIPSHIDKALYQGWNWLWYDTRIVSATTHRTLSVSGMFCANRNCNTYHQMAQPNQPDGKFLCYSCRQLPSYMRKI